MGPRDGRVVARRNRRLGRQNAARIFRQGDRQVGLAFGLRMGLWLEDVPRAEVGRRQIERDSRSARTDRHARSPGGRRHRRRDALPNRDGREDRRQKSELRTDGQRQSRNLTQGIAGRHGGGVRRGEPADADSRTCEKNRDRHETREVTVLPVPTDEPVFQRWAEIRTIGWIYRSREINGRLEEAQEHFISSLPCKVRAIGKHLRSHWSTENSQHHVLDVIFTEDASRIRRGNGPEVTSVFRRLALNILQRDTSLKGSIRGKRKLCGWDERSFELLLAGFSEN